MQRVKDREIEIEQRDRGDSDMRYSPFRWLILFAYCTQAVANNIQFSSYVPIWGSAAVYYNISQLDLQWSANVYYLAEILFAPFFIVLIQWRLDYSLIVAAVLSAIGSWIIWAAGESYVIGLVGFGLLGIAQSIYLGMPIYIGEIWFSLYERTLAVCIGSYATNASLLVGYTYSSFLFLNVTDQLVINKGIQDMNLVIAIICTASLGFCLMFSRRRKQVQESTDTIFDQFWQLLTNEEAMLDILSLATFIGVGWTYLTLVSLQLATYGLNQAQVATVGILYQVSGILIGFLASIKLDKQASIGVRPKYDKYIKITTLIGFLSHIVESIWSSYFNYYMLLFSNFMVGIGFNTMYPLAMLVVAEKQYPIPSLIPVILILMIACLIGFVLAYLVLLPVLATYSLWISIIMITPPLLYIQLFYKTKFNKFDLSQ